MQSPELPILGRSHSRLHEAPNPPPRVRISCRRARVSMNSESSDASSDSEKAQAGSSPGFRVASAWCHVQGMYGPSRVRACMWAVKVIQQPCANP